MSEYLPLLRTFFERDVLAATRSLESLGPEAALGVLRELPVDLAGQALSHLAPPFAARLMLGLPQDRLPEVLERMAPEQIAAVLITVPEDARPRIVEGLPARRKALVRELLTYPVDSAGRMMSTDFLAFHVDMTVNDTIEKLRALSREGAPPSYAYILDDDERLVGVINMRDLVLAPGDTRLKNFTRPDVFTLGPFLSRSEVLEALRKRRFFAAPVVDSNQRMLGLIRASQLVGEAQDKVGEDLMRMFGAGGDERPFSPVGYSLKKRLPWLHVNLVTAFMAAAVVALFEDLIARTTVLAVFLPVVAGQGGNAGAQSLAVVMRGLVMREIPQNMAFRLVSKEMLLGTLSGLVTGLVTAVVAGLWSGRWMFGVVIALAMVINLMAAGFAGAGIPLAMKRMGLDPAQSSNIILTTVTDVVGFFAFLGIAMLLESHLV